MPITELTNDRKKCYSKKIVAMSNDIKLWNFSKNAN